MDTAGPLKPENPVPEFKLVAVEMSSRLAKYLPLVAVGGDPNRERMIPFDAWWTEPVLKDSKGVKFSRSNLVSHVADTDGGAHVDSELEESYMALSRQNSIGGTFGRGEESVPIQGRLELACIRQIAHEVLATIRQGASRFAEAAAPVIPASVGAPGEKRLIVQYLEIGPDLSK